MKLKAFLSILAVGLCAALGWSGCKPKETTITGQVFVATQGGATIRLGAVRVQLIEKQQVVDFLAAKRARWIEDLATAEKALQEARVRQSALVASNPAPTSVEYLQTKEELAAVLEEIGATDRVLKAWETNNKQLHESYLAVTDPIKRDHLAQRRVQLGLTRATGTAAKRPIPGVSQETLKNASDALTLAQTTLREKQQEASRLQARLAELEEPLRKRAEEVESAQAQVSSVKAKMLKTQSLGELLSDFHPQPIRTADTDADGNFSSTIPRGNQYAIYARARRATFPAASSTSEVDYEDYCWLVDAPSDSKSNRVLLNNNNLTGVDPDGYLKASK